MHTAVAALLALGAAIVVVGCSGLKRVDPGFPRIEVEVDYGLDDAFGVALAPPFDEVLLERVIRDAIDPLTDIGLRFYPVPSELYGPTQERPRYVMRIRAVELTPTRELEPIRVDGPPPEVGETGSSRPVILEARVQSLRFVIEVKLERQRQDAPRLVIVQSRGVGEARPSRADVSHRFALARHSIEVNETDVTARMLFDAAERAARQVFLAMQPAVDRELALIAAKAVP